LFFQTISFALAIYNKTFLLALLLRFSDFLPIEKLYHSFFQRISLEWGHCSPELYGPLRLSFLLVEEKDLSSFSYPSRFSFTHASQLEL
jgi:hypothetical protein